MLNVNNSTEAKLPACKSTDVRRGEVAIFLKQGTTVELSPAGKQVAAGG